MKTRSRTDGAYRGVAQLKAVLLATAVLGASAAGAQETATSVGANEEELVVTARRYVPEGSLTATKTDAPLIETPQSVSVITRDQIDLLNFIDLQQSIRYTAGIVGENYGPDLRYDFLTLRGFTPVQYVDGLQAPIGSTITNVGVDIYGFESVDVLKGPASVLYGTTPPGGIYNLTSRRPSDEMGGELGVKYGTDDYKQIQGTVTGPLSDSFSARLTGLYRDRDSQVDFVKAKRAFAAPAATLRFGERTSLTALAYYQYDKVDGDTNGFLPVFGTLLPNPLGRVPISTNIGEPDYNTYKRNQFGVGWDLSHGFTDALTFQQNTKWFRVKESQFVIYGGGGLLDADFNGTPDDFRTVSRFNFPFREAVHEFAIDNRVRAEFDLGAIENTLLVGLDYRNYRDVSEFGFGVASSIDLFDPVYNAAPIVTPPFGPFANQRIKQTGVYLQNQAKIGGLVVTLAGRNDWVKTNNRNAGTETKDDKFSYRIGANYVLESGFAPYVSYATSFQPVAGVDAAGNDFVPSVGKQIEGGIKYDARNLGPDVKLFATASIFRIKQENVVTTANDPANPFANVQTGEIEVDGAELEFVSRFRERLSINAAYSYIDGEVTKSNGPDLGAPLATQPKHKLSAFADYTFQDGPMAGLGLGFGGRHLSKSPGSLPGPFNPVVYFTESTTLFDALVRYDFGGWRAALNGANIFDKKYVGRCAGPANCIYGQRRQVILSLTRQF